MSEMNIGMKNALILLGPRSRKTSCCSSNVLRPPIPLPMITPTRSGSYIAGSVNPASLIACADAAMAY